MSKHGGACTLRCVVCGESPTLYQAFHKGYCALHKEEARKRMIVVDGRYEAIYQYRRTTDVLLTKV